MKKIVIDEDNIAKHGVSEDEVRECLNTRGVRYFRKARRDAYQVIAQTLAGRYLEVVYKIRPDVIHVFHAMDARPWQIKLLKRRGKRA
jgi:uncharacterized DUF497 family protein